MSVHASPLPAPTSKLPYERERLEDIGYMTCMTLTLLGNYAQTGHFGGPLAYTPFNVAAHLAGPQHGGLRSDLLRPLDDHGAGAVPEVPGDRRQGLLRGARRCDAAGGRAGISPRRGR